MSQAPCFPVGWQSVLTLLENSFESFWSWSVELGGRRRGQGLESGSWVCCILLSGAGPHAAHDPTKPKRAVGRQRPYPPCDLHCQGQRPGSVFPTGHLDASMAATNLENQLHSAQKNVLFLQREHASTLKGLHAEIRRLQQHCTGAKGPHERAAGLPGTVVQSRTLTRARSDGGRLCRLSEGISPSWSPRACRTPSADRTLHSGQKAAKPFFTYQGLKRSKCSG